MSNQFIGFFNSARFCITGGNTRWKITLLLYGHRQNDIQTPEHGQPPCVQPSIDMTPKGCRISVGPPFQRWIVELNQLLHFLVDGLYTGL